MPNSVFLALLFNATTSSSVSEQNSLVPRLTLSGDKSRVQTYVQKKKNHSGKRKKKGGNLETVGDSLEESMETAKRGLLSFV